MYVITSTPSENVVAKQMYVLKTGVEVLKLFSCSTQLCLADKYQITKHCNFFLAKHS